MIIQTQFAFAQVSPYTTCIMFKYIFSFSANTIPNPFNSYSTLVISQLGISLQRACQLIMFLVWLFHTCYKIKFHWRPFPVVKALIQFPKPHVNRTQAHAINCQSSLSRMAFNWQNCPQLAQSLIPFRFGHFFLCCLKANWISSVGQKENVLHNY